MNVLHRVAIASALVLLPAAGGAAQLSPAEKAELKEVAGTVIDRFIDQVQLPAFVRSRQAEWSSTGQPYTDGMADNDRRLALVFAGAMLVWHKAVDKGVAVAMRARAAPGPDPRVQMREEFVRVWALFGGTLSAMARRWPVDPRHASLAAELQGKYGGHEAFKEALADVQPELAGRKCRLRLEDRLERFKIREAEDYRQYKALHSDRNWAERNVRDELIPLVVFAPCLAHHEIFERGEPRQGLRTLSDAIEVGNLLRIRPEMSINEANNVLGLTQSALLGVLVYLGWLDAGMP